MNRWQGGFNTVFWLIATVLFLTANSFAASPQNSHQRVMIVSGHPDYPPIMWHHNDTITGVGAELVRTVCKELNIPFEIQYQGPWKRVQMDALHGNIDLILGIYSNTERREYLDYTSPYLLDLTSITVDKNKQFLFDQLDDLKNKTGVTLHGDSFGQKLDEYMDSNLDVQRVYTVDALFKNLMAGRSDYIIWGYYPTIINATRLGLKDNILIFDYSVVVEGMHMAFSKKSPFKQHTEQINGIIKRLKEEGKIKEWTAKYLSLYHDSSKGLTPELQGE